MLRYIESYRIGCLNIDFFDTTPRQVSYGLSIDTVLDDLERRKLHGDTSAKFAPAWL